MICFEFPTAEVEFRLLGRVHSLASSLINVMFIQSSAGIQFPIPRSWKNSEKPTSADKVIFPRVGGLPYLHVRVLRFFPS